MAMSYGGFCLAAFAIQGALADTVAPTLAGWPMVNGAPGACQTVPVSVIKDVQGAEKWPGACLDLKQITDAATSTYTPESCKAACLADPTCHVWQLTDADKCWLGVPGNYAVSCETRDGENGEPGTVLPGGTQPGSHLIKAGQRLQHGSVKVVRSLSAEWVEGLYVEGLQATNATRNAQRCKEQCYSDIYCRFWQYGADGCERERKGTGVPDSPVISNTSTAARTQIAGEIIEHSCPPPKTTPPPSHTLRNVLIALASLLLLLLLLLCIYFAFCKKESKPKKTRAVKKAVPKEPAQPLVPVQTVQYVSVPQYSVVQQPAPVVSSVVYSSPPVMVQEQAPLLAGGSVAMPVAGSVAAPMPMAGSVIMA